MPIRRVERQEGEDGEVEYKVDEAPQLEPWPADAPFSEVGRARLRLEGPEKVRGRAVYTADLRLPKMLFARVLRSPHPHARIVRIETSKAAALPGVHAVLSSANAPEIDWYEEGKLFDRTVRFVGDEVAAVAAESEELAEDALRLIEVEYERLPFVASLEAAAAPGAPRVYPGGNVSGEPGNVSGEPKSLERGDIKAGFAEADVIVEGEYTTQTALHNALEAHGATAQWEGDQLNLWASTQAIFQVREDVAGKLAIPEHKLRVIKQHMGGGFGAKQIAWKQDVIAALLARASGRPVQLMLDRAGENLAAGNRNATRQRVRIGAKRDGALTAIEAEAILETGAYQTGGEASDVIGIYGSLYRCPNLRAEQRAYYTNAGPAVAFRAPGYAEGAFGLESAMDELARKLEMDPVALRLKNYATEDQEKAKPYTTPEALRVCIERAAAAFGWGERRAGEQCGRVRRGVGFAAHDWMGGKGNPPGYATIKLNADGSVDVITGTQDIGTGTRTALAQVAAEALTLPLEQVALHLGDTATGLYSPASAGSATQATIGPAIHAAAEELKRQLLIAAAPMLEEEPAKLSVRDGKVCVTAAPATAISIAEIAGRIAPHMLQAQGARGPNTEAKTIHTVGAQFVEVEVDTETGEVTVLRVAAAHDAGRIINPLLLDSQVIGGVTQGLGQALTEERVMDTKLGAVLNANLEEYKVPTVADIPPITHARVNLPDLEANSTGAKGIGESPIIPTAPAVANAVYDAIGVRIRHLPLARRRIVEALQEEAADATV
jgi:CO/xanthine dehydrogenase Mo-binding subunit